MGEATRLQQPPGLQPRAEITATSADRIHAGNGVWTHSGRIDSPGIKKGVIMEFLEMLEFKRERTASARRRAMRVRQQRIERLIAILFRMVMLAAVLMILAGAGVIDAGRTVTAEVYGALMMLGGGFVIVVGAAIFGGSNE